MLRSRFLAMAVLAVVSSGPVWAEESKQAPKSEAKAGGAVSETKVAAAEPDASASGTSSDSASVAETPKAEPVKKPAPLPAPTMTVKIDLATQSMTVYENGSAIHSWPISSGTSSHPTPRGTFRPQWTAKMWYSRKYDNAPMPNSVFIHGGVAIHATPYVSRLGSPASHGCIRLAPANARTFYSLVHKHGLKKVRVSVFGTPNYRAYASSKSQRQVATQVPPPSSNSGWSWLFGPSQYEPTSAYNPNFTKPRKKVRQYVDKRTGRVYIVQNGKRIYVKKPSKPKYTYNSNSYFGSSW